MQWSRLLPDEKTLALKQCQEQLDRRQMKVDSSGSNQETL
jgi:hypothetical protein